MGPGVRRGDVGALDNLDNDAVTSLVSSNRLNNFLKQIQPGWIERLDQPYLPNTSPFFERAFTRDGFLHQIMQLIPNQYFYSMFFGKTICQIFFVLPNTLDQIGGNTDVERAIRAARQNIDSGLLHATSPIVQNISASNQMAGRNVVTNPTSLRRTPGPMIESVLQGSGLSESKFAFLNATTKNANSAYPQTNPSRSAPAMDPGVRRGDSVAQDSLKQVVPSQDAATLETQLLFDLLAGKNIEAGASALRAAREKNASLPDYTGRLRFGADSDAEAKLFTRLTALSTVLNDVTPAPFATRKQAIELTIAPALTALKSAEFALSTRRDALLAAGRTGAAARLSAAITGFHARRITLEAALSQAKAALTVPSSGGAGAKLSLSLPALDALIATAIAPGVVRSLGLRTLPVAQPAFAARAPVELPAIAAVYTKDVPPQSLVSAADLALEVGFSDYAAATDELRVLTRPSAILDFVSTRMETQFYAGSRQSAPTTAELHAGNDVDQATLLIQLLRRAGYPARYQFGVVEYPLVRLAPALGLTLGATSASDVAQALARAGVAARPILAAGQVSAFAVEHTFVSALIP